MRIYKAFEATPGIIRFYNLFLDLKYRHLIQPEQQSVGSVNLTSNPESRAAALTGLIQKFPYWKQGRNALSVTALLLDDSVLSIAESNAYKILNSGTDNL